PGGKVVATAANDGAVKLWQFGSTVTYADSSVPVTPLRVFMGHAERVVALRFSPDGNKLASMSASGEVRIWDAGKIPPPYIEPGFDVNFDKAGDLVQISTDN